MIEKYTASDPSLWPTAELERAISDGYVRRSVTTPLRAEADRLADARYERWVEQRLAEVEEHRARAEEQAADWLTDPDRWHYTGDE